MREAAGRGAGTSLRDPARVRPALQVRVPGSPAPGQGLAVPPHLWRDPGKSQSRVRARGPRRPPGSGTDFPERSSSPCRELTGTRGALGAPRG